MDDKDLVWEEVKTEHIVQDEWIDFSRQQMPIVNWFSEQMPGGFFVYRADESQELLYSNKATYRIFGCESSEEFKTLTGCTFRGIVHPDDYARVEESIGSQISNSANANMDYVEYRIIRKDGSIRWVEDYGHYAQFPGYGAVYYVFLTDVTEKKQIQEENRLAAEVIEGLCSDYACIYLVDPKSGEMRAYHLQNDFFRDISRKVGLIEGTKADYQSVLRSYVNEYIIPEDQDMFLSLVNDGSLLARAREESSFTINFRCHTPVGEIAYVAMTVNRAGSEQSFDHVVLGFRDVTEDTLIFQREMAEKMEMEYDLQREKHANEIKSQFLFNVSHDIRTPMNAVMGFAGLAKRHLGDSEQAKDDIEKVEEAGRQLLSLIDDLLEMSSIEYGRVELKEDVCDLREQIGMVLSLFETQAKEKGVALVDATDLPEQNVRVDAARFRRVLSDLISNAVKFTPNGGKITVSAFQKNISSSGYARYSFLVADTGIGMSQEFIHRLYRAFERESSSTEAGTTGSGLGLSIAKNLVDMMGGSLSVESEKGKGSTFTLDLPLKVAEYAAADAPAEDVPPEPFEKEKYRILLVEDIKINRMLAEKVLREAGFLVESVEDGSDAVEAVKTHEAWYYDLILMDIQMPVMNGYEASRAIRALLREDVKMLPIIALSANAREEDKRMSIESGMNNHVAKPFDVGHLIATITEHIKRTNRNSTT